MEYLSDPWLVAALLVSGVIAGFVNTLAGGGGLLILPLLMLTGMGPALANGTMRVGVLLQGIEGVRQFHRHGSMTFAVLPGIMIPTLAGALVGTLAASFLPPEILKPVLLTTLIVMAVIMVVKPSTLMPGPDEAPRDLKNTPAAWAGLFLVGAYGGFAQAGVGFIMIAVLAGQLRYDLVRTNALKLAITTGFTILALAIFAWRGQVALLPGLVLAAGMVVGVRFGVGFAHRVSQRMLKWILLVMVVAVCAAAAIKG
ncbi:sulfite exporter TauE/SafE family protein [Alloalcanivorax mobilis]|uniref:sulfite exporter TauE/SafE family protein n=1 Tax=Alloalcanivorax mobilis TaxID=2019569 RepID=UPI000B5B0D39|nr:sulfite exporter TauE/SafE family protein [Alloalcanivorax mobilis]ASK34527.1 permease [Alcanivorax sp. N3-2A]